MTITLIPQTNQEAFDMAVDRLYDGTGRAYDEVTCGCLYRTADGRKCVVGQMIPDDQYYPGIEMNNVIELVNKDHINANGIDPKLLSDLQAEHDHSFNWSPDGRFLAVTLLMGIGRSFNLNLNHLIAVEEKARFGHAQ